MLHQLWLMVMGVIVLSGCATRQVFVKTSPGIELAGRATFRMNYAVHDPEGKVITDEVMETELERWLLFTEMAGAVRACFEDRGYEWVYDPVQPADFVVDVGFTAFYSEKVTREEMERQRAATLMVGGVRDGRYLHMVVIRVMARAPGSGAEGFVTVWEGRGIAESKEADVRVAGFPLIAEIVGRFPRAERR
ncbi:MAG: hypothetical protein N2595_04920 [bacterium]|nr:hypothetical protein [bacterium]